MTPDWHPIWNHIWRLARPFEYFVTFAIGGGAVWIRRYWQKLREDRAASWPSASAVIQSATVKAHEGYDVQLSYRYYALQEYRYGRYSRHFRKKAEAEEFAAAVRGRPVQVRYREDKPEVSVLMERDLDMANALLGQARFS
jgi:hypothetical protein